jgi:regulator of cell morphogenesis and NO signaling
MPRTDPANSSLGALVAERPARAALFERLRLDYCCGGGQTLAEACLLRGLDPHTVGELIVALDDGPLDHGEPVEECDWRQAGIAELCDHIVAAHHDRLRTELPRIAETLATVVRVHGAEHPELHDVERLFVTMREDLESHIEQEEQVLFPACRAVERGEPWMATPARSCWRPSSTTTRARVTPSPRCASSRTTSTRRGRSAAPTSGC